jgi:hypothetical protein
VQSLLHAAAAAAFGHWLARRWLDAGLVAAVWGTLAFAALAAWAGWRWSAAPACRIAWTGAQWTTSCADAVPVESAPPRVMLDLGPWLLLSIRPVAGGRRLWVGLSRADAGASWRPFRAAVYSFLSDSMPRSPEERPPF